MKGEPKAPASRARKTQPAPTPNTTPSPRRSIEDYSQDELIEALTKAAPRRWMEREELLKLAATKLGFARIGANIRQRFKSAFTGAIRRGFFEYQGTQIRRK